MTKYTYVIAFCLALSCTSTILGQQYTDDIESKLQSVKKYTLMERFEPDLALSASERERLKAERFAEIKSKMRMLDTMDISERKREKLLSDIIDRPYSSRLSRNLADGQFEEQ